MPSGKEVRELDIEREKSGVSPSDRSDTGPETGFPDFNKHTGTYERCMQAYRWLSQRYRKTLDALAK